MDVNMNMNLKKVPTWLQNSVIFSATLLVSVLTVVSAVMVSGPVMLSSYTL